MNKKIDIVKEQLRKRIDGMNFTLIHPFEKEIENLSDAEREQFKIHQIEATIKKINKALNYQLGEVGIFKLKAVADLTKQIGIYIVIYFRGNDLYTVIQFKGFFFIQDNAFEYVKAITRNLSYCFDSIFRITTVDIAQDFLVHIDDLLPNPAYSSGNHRYCFRFKSRNYFESLKNYRQKTGFEIQSGRFKLIVYDKKSENKGTTNKKKKEYYENLFKEYPNKPVTRIELRLKQEMCKNLLDVFYSDISEHDFIALCFHQFTLRHKLRSRKGKSVDTDFRRWPIHPHWKIIFNNTHIPNQNSFTDYLYTNPSKDIKRSMTKLIDTLATAYPDITEDELKERLNQIVSEEVMEKVKARVRRRSLTEEKFKSLKEEMLGKVHSINLHHNVGSFITSPLERSHTLNSDT